MACSDVQTIQAGNGTKTQFSFDFPYIFKSEIHVYFWNAVTKEYDEKLTTDATYPWQITDANPTIVEFTGTAPPSPATPVDPGEPTVDNVKIRRITKVDDIRALFNPGSAIRSDDLNKNFEQLRYAIQEANCQGIPDDVDAYLKEYYWDRFDNTLYQADTWRSDDATIATTAALDQRFQDEVSETFTKAELAAASNQMPDNDTAVPTTGAINDYIDEVITNDIGTDGTGITVNDDGDGTITLGLADNTIDFDKIKDADQIKLADQVSDPDVVGTDNNIFTAQAATRRFNNYYQNSAPSVTDGVGIGQVWVDPNDDLTLSVWNGTSWIGITSGGTFSNQPKVVYVDAGSGDDSNDGHRISRPKKTIAAALSDINSDSDGDGSIVSVAPGIYAETLPLDIQKNDIGIIGQSLRTCIIHPKIPTADQATYDVDTPHSQELQTMFRVNSGTYVANLTLTGLKASGTRGGNSLYTDSTYGLPTNQGWNFGFYTNAVIKKSPYIQNVTNFSDSQINNVNFTPHTPGEGAAGDLDSAPTGGGILIDGSVPSATSPLRSMVCDSYTHTALDGPGIFVTNNGYCQATSSYAFFNHAHITCVNGGQANLAASTTDFGRYGLIADGKSTSAIFTSNVDGAASDGAISFNVNEPTAGAGWFGDTERPATNMLVEVNSIIYPILSATANTDSEGGNGWTVTISRPDTTNRSNNLGLNGAISDNAAVSFYLRSMIASSSHTMEYVGSGTNYNALPENGGVPTEANQKIELNDGKIWTATTDHNGKFTIGGNQTDDPFFEVDQQLGLVTIPEGSIAFNLLSDLTPQLGGDLDVNGKKITSASNGNIVIEPNGTGVIDVNDTRITEVTDPTAAQDAATKNYVDTGFVDQTSATGSANLPAGTTAQRDSTPAAGMLRYNSTLGRFEGYTSYWGDIGGAVAISSAPPSNAAAGDVWYDHDNGRSYVYYNDGDSNQWVEMNPAWNGLVTDGSVTPAKLSTGGPYWSTSGNVGIGTTSPQNELHISSGDSATRLQITNSTTGSASGDGTALIQSGNDFYINNRESANLYFATANSTAATIDSSGRLLVGTSSDTSAARFIVQGLSSDVNAQGVLDIRRGTRPSVTDTEIGSIRFKAVTGDGRYAQISAYSDGASGSDADTPGSLRFSTTPDGSSGATERMRIDSSGNVGIGVTSVSSNLHINPASDGTFSNGLRVQRYSTPSQYGVFNYSGGALNIVATDIAGSTPVTRFFRSTNGTTTTESMRIDSSGRLLVGTSSTPPADTADVFIKGSTGSGGRGGLTIARTNTNPADGNGLGSLYFADSSANPATTIEGQRDGGTWTSGSSQPSRLVFATTPNGAPSPTERMRISSSGVVTIKTNQSSSARNRVINLECSGQGRGALISGNSDTDPATLGAGSDRRLKTNIRNYTNGLERIKQIPVKIYDEVNTDATNVIGWVADEVSTVFPDAVIGEPNAVDAEGNPEYQMLASLKFYPDLVQCVQTLITKIETLEAKVAQLEAN